MHRSFPKLLFGILWSAVALSFLIAADPPDPMLTAKLKSPRSPMVAGWLRGGRGVLRPVVIVAAHLNALDEINPFSYTIEPNGTLTANDPVTDTILLDFARLNNIRVIPTIASGWDNTRNLSRILTDAKMRQTHIDAILKVARTPGVDGVDLDYENLAPESRAAYTNFVATLAAQLHLEGKILSVTVPPKNGPDDPCVSCRFADYPALGAVADRFRVMAYEFHGKSGAPGAIAPVWWIRQVMDYTVSQVPRERVHLGVRLYGYDWGGKETPAVWWNDVQALKEKYGGEVEYVDTDARGFVGENVLTYSIVQGKRCPRSKPECIPPNIENHAVWFVDARYVAANWEIVKEYQLGGIVLWRPSGEDPAVWEILNPPANTNSN